MKYIVRDRNGFVLLVSYSEQQAYEMAETDADSTVEELSEIPDDNKRINKKYNKEYK